MSEFIPPSPEELFKKYVVLVEGDSTVIGRDVETEQLASILLGHYANIGVIVGEPGAGKTQVVEGLAKTLKKKSSENNIYSITYSDVFHFTENDFVSFIEDISFLLVENIQQKVRKGFSIIFLREIYLFIEDDKIRAANLFYALRRFAGKYCGHGIRFCFELTSRQYEKMLKNYPEAPVYMQPVWIDPLSREFLHSVLMAAARKLNFSHSVPFSSDAILAAMDISDKYQKSQYQPMKAIKLLDSAAAINNLSSNKVNKIGIDQIAYAAKLSYNLKSLPNASPFSANISGLHKKISSRVFGQLDAIDALITSIKTAVAGLRNPSKPIGVFLFTGWSGTGKTEMAKAIAFTLYDSEDALVRFDMSEFHDHHCIDRLIGTAPSYKNSEVGGELTNALLKNTDRIILFDEIEKAHPSILDLMLQIFDDGRLTDGWGRVADFSRSIIILTSNLGVRELIDHDGKNAIGFGRVKDTGEKTVQDIVMSEIKRYLRPELINRMSRIVYFNKLTPEILKKIAYKLFQRTQSQLEHRGIILEIKDQLIELIVKESDTTKAGRGVEEAYKKILEAPLSENILDGRIGSGKWKLDIDKKNDLKIMTLTE